MKNFQGCEPTRHGCPSDNRGHARSRYGKIAICHLLSAIFLLSICTARFGLLNAQQVTTSDKTEGSKRTFTLSNPQVSYTLTLDSGKIAYDRLVAQDGWAKQHGGIPQVVTTSAGATANIMWTDWQAPNKVNNAENPIDVSADQFRLDARNFAIRSAANCSTCIATAPTFRFSSDCRISSRPTHSTSTARSRSVTPRTSAISSSRSPPSHP